jgi:hypothetical protein
MCFREVSLYRALFRDRAARVITNVGMHRTPQRVVAREIMGIKGLSAHNDHYGYFRSNLIKKMKNIKLYLNLLYNFDPINFGLISEE